MKTTILSTILCLFTIITFGQYIKYEKTFDEAAAKARVENKLIFLTISAPVPPNSNTKCGLDIPTVADEYNNHFINYKISITDIAGNKLQQRFHTNTFPAYIFIDTAGLPVYKDSKNSVSDVRYINMADTALERSAGKTLTYYHKQFVAKALDGSSLKDYILLRESFDIYANAGLINDYVDYLPVKALGSYQDVLFILKAGPIVSGKAYRLAYTYQRLVDSIYKTEPVTDRIAINERIYTNTFNEMIAKKSILLAQNLSKFEYSSHRSNIRSAEKASKLVFVNYYHIIRDTANYLKLAANYYDEFYMNISADSAKALIDNRIKAVLKNSSRNAVANQDSTDEYTNRFGPDGNPIKKMMSFSFISSSSPDVTYTLNSAAYSVYLTGTNNQVYLHKAISWCQRAIAYNHNAPFFYDTLAHLLYCAGDYVNAEESEKFAVEMVLKQKQEAASMRMKAELAKIASHTL